MRFGALIFDFDGVLLESEYVGNAQIADCLTGLGHPTSIEQAMAEFMGLSGADFLAAVERWIGRPVPDAFHRARHAEDERVLAEGIEAVAGAVAFVEALPPALPRAVASSSTSRWVRAHLDHLKLRERFEPHIYSGREHVARGKPAQGTIKVGLHREGSEMVIVLEDDGKMSIVPARSSPCSARLRAPFTLSSSQAIFVPEK